MIWTFSGSLGHFLDHPDTLQNIWIFCKSSVHFPDHRSTFQIIRALFRSSGHFSDHRGTFQIIRTLFRSSGHFSIHPKSQDIFHINQTLFVSSVHFSDHPDTFQIIRILQNILDTHKPARKLSGQVFVTLDRTCTKPIVFCMKAIASDLCKLFLDKGTFKRALLAAFAQKITSSVFSASKSPGDPHRKCIAF